MNKLVMFYAEVDAVSIEDIPGIIMDQEREAILILRKQPVSEENDFIQARKLAIEAGWKNVEVLQAGVVDPDINDNQGIYLAKQSAMQFGYAILRTRDVLAEPENG